MLGSSTVPTPRRGDAETLWGALASVVRGVLERDAGGDVLACGVGCGGPMRDRGAAVSPLNIPGWREFPLRRRLEELTGLPVFVDNDAKALALAEGRFGGAGGRQMPAERNDRFSVVSFDEDNTNIVVDHTTKPQITYGVHRTEEGAAKVLIPPFASRA